MRIFTLSVVMSFLCLIGTAQTNHDIVVSSNSFSPNELAIEVGDMVTWTNSGGFHNVNGSLADYPSNPEGFANGGASSTAWTFQRTFNTVGTYQYQCDPHVGLGMTGTITVTESSGGTPNIVITEIMYNPPEAGTDQLEFVEIYNNGTSTADLSNYAFSEGFEFSFPDGFILDAGAYAVVASNATEFENSFGIAAMQFTSGGLSNGGEDIILVNADSTVVIDVVDYDDQDGWPTTPDSFGPSLVLCDVDSDNNLAENWAAANTSAGFSVNNTEVFANPYAASECPDGAIIRFIETGVEVDEGVGTFDIGVEISNAGQETYSVALDALLTSTATYQVDYDFSLAPFVMVNPNPIDTFYFTVSVIDDMVEEDLEQMEFSFFNPSNNLTVQGVGATTSYFIVDNDNDTPVGYNMYTIGEVTGNDAEGVADSIDVLAELTGVVYGVNLRPGGLQFTIIDAAGDGIGTFSNSEDFGFTVTEGDEVTIKGAIGQFSGLTQIYIDSVSGNSAGNALVAPTVVTALGEDTESQLVELEGVTVDSWVSAGGGLNVTVSDGGGATHIVRIDLDTDVTEAFIMGAQGAMWNITGIGGQFDSSAPHDEGYQLLPRYQTDFEMVISTTEPEWASVVSLAPNPVRESLEVTLPFEVDQVQLFDAFGRLIQTHKSASNQLSVNMTNLASGNYFIRLIDGNEAITRKVIKQ